MDLHIAQVLRGGVADIDRDDGLVEGIVALEVGEDRGGAATVTGVVDVDLVARLRHVPKLLEGIDQAGVGGPVALGRAGAGQRSRELENVVVGHLQIIAEKGVYVLDVAHRATQLGIADAVDETVVVVVDADEQGVKSRHIRFPHELFQPIDAVVLPASGLAGRAG